MQRRLAKFLQPRSTFSPASSVASLLQHEGQLHSHAEPKARPDVMRGTQMVAWIKEQLCGRLRTNGKAFEAMSIRTNLLMLLILLVGLGAFQERASAQMAPDPGAQPSPTSDDSDSPSWLFPIAKLDESLPSWLHIGGEYRARLEGPIGIGYT